MPVTIRFFGEGDVAGANALTNLYIRETAVHFGTLEARDEDFAEAWRGREARHPWLAAEVDGRFAGYAKAGAWRAREAYRFTAETSVYIHPDFHGRGVGRALMTELIGLLGREGFHTLVAGATMPNQGSAALHEGLGFRRVGVFPEVGRKFDRWWDVGWWALTLDPERTGEGGGRRGSGTS